MTDGGTLSSVIQNSIDTVTGHTGAQTQALHLNVLQKIDGTTQDPLLIEPAAGQAPNDFYISDWIKLPADTASLLGPGGWVTALPEVKAAGDFRVVTALEVDGTGTAHYHMKWDNNANGNLPAQTFYSQYNNTAVVPFGQWAHVEFSFHRDATAGEAVMKVDGQTIFDHVGNTVGVNNAPVNRIFVASPYSSNPMNMLVDDVQVWDGTPTTTPAPTPIPAPAPAPTLAPTPTPVPTLVPTPAPSPPAPVTYGAGPDTLALRVSEDAWQGDAQFTVSIDGEQVGGVHTATALHGRGATQDVSIGGTWGAGPHTVGVSFINDAYGGTAATDRNLYVDAVTYDGRAAGGAPATLLSDGTASFAVAAPAAATPLTLHLAEDAWQGDAQYSVAIDGATIAPNGTVTALNGSGGSQAVNLSALLSAGTHDLAISFTNDAWGGTASTDRNLYVKGIDVGSTPVAGATATLVSNGAAHFQITVPSS